MLHSFNLHPPVIAPRMVNYGTSDPPSPLHESSEESVTTKGNTTPRNNPPNLVPNVLLTRIWIQVLHILIDKSHLTHLTTSILNTENI